VFDVYILHLNTYRHISKHLQSMLYTKINYRMIETHLTI